MACRPRARRTLAPQPPPPEIYASGYCLELGAQICRRLAAGESLRAICRADPTMPTEKTVWNWARTNEAFALMKAHAQQVARAASLGAQTEQDAARRAAKAAARTARGWRPMKAWDDSFDVEIEDAVCLRLMLGQSLTAICRDPAMPSIGTVYNWLRRHPAFVEAYRKAREIQPEQVQEQGLAGLPPPRRGTLRMTERALKAVDRRIAQLAPKRYAPAAAPDKLRVVLATGPDEQTELYPGLK